MNLERKIEQTKESLIAEHGKKCQMCNAKEDLTIDHIIPMHILTNFGITRKETYESTYLLQLLCKRCNQLKTDRIDWKNPKSKKIFEYLLDEIA